MGEKMELEIDKGFTMLQEELAKILDHMIAKFEGYIVGRNIEETELESRKQIWITWILFLTTIGLLLYLFRQKGFVPIWSSYSKVSHDETQEFVSFNKELIKRDKHLVLHTKDFVSEDSLSVRSKLINNNERWSQSEDKKFDIFQSLADGQDHFDELNQQSLLRNKKKCSCPTNIYVLHEGTMQSEGNNVSVGT